MKKSNLILASSSPRRQELLAGLGLSFRVIVPQVEEIPGPDESPAAFAERAAGDKAHWVAERIVGEKNRSLVIAGDTIVVLDDRILGKPCDEAEAAHMLRALSGRTHEVISGLCVLETRHGEILREHSRTVHTKVTFKQLSESEVETHVASGEPLDKAGAYALQGGANYMVRRIAGSHSNVIGLPLCELVEMLTKKFGYSIF